MAAATESVNVRSVTFQENRSSLFTAVSYCHAARYTGLTMGTRAHYIDRKQVLLSSPWRPGSAPSTD